MKFTFLLINLLVITSSIFSQTKLSEKLGDTILTKAGSPYFVEDNVYILSNSTVTVKEGCVFLFYPFSGITVAGNLIVEGTDTEPVVFTSLNDSIYNQESSQLANPFDWNGIHITLEAGRAVLSDFILKYSVYGLKSSLSSVVIRNGIFAHNGQFNCAVKETLVPAVENLPFNYNGEAVSIEKKTAPVDTPPPEPEKKSGKRRGFIIAGIAVGAVAVAVPAIYFFVIKKPAGSDSTVITITD